MPQLTRRDFAVIGLSTLFVGRLPPLVHPIRSNGHAALVIRPFTPNDADAVGRLVDADYLNDADRASSLHAINRGLHLPAAPSDVWRVALVAELDGTVIGAGSSRSLPMSRQARTHVIVAASHRRQGTGTRLYNEVASRVRADGRTPIASIAAREALAFDFASACGMQPLMRSRQLTVDLTSWAVERWSRDAIGEPGPYTLVPGAQVTPDVLFGALGAAYHYMHERWSDVQVGTVDQYRATWSGRVSEGSAVVALDGERAVGVGNYFANRAVEGGVVVFPTGVCAALPSLDHERALTARLLGDRLLAARSAGKRVAILEFDDDDGRLLSVIASIPVTGINETYMLTAGASSHWPGRS